MQVKITYTLKSGKQVSRSFIRPTVKEALKFFDWRYGHKIIKVETV